MAVQGNTMNWNKMVEMALETWQPGNNPMLHALLGLAGEAGEMIDQYKKYLYKDGYECSLDDFLDELGNFWYYLRIVSHLKGIRFLTSQSHILPYSELDVLVKTLVTSSKMLEDYYIISVDITNDKSYDLYSCLLTRLSELGCTIEELTQINYDKLSDSKRGY